MKHFFLLVFALFCTAAFGDPRPFKEIFIPEISQQADGAGYVTTIRIPIPDGYYLYADKTNIDKSTLPEGAAIDKSQAKQKQDDYFGTVQVYTPEHPAVLTVHTPNAVHEVTLKTQGCEEGVVCYPPTSFTLNVEAGGDVSISPQTAFGGGFLQQKAQAAEVSAAASDAPAPSAAPAALTDTDAGGALSASRLHNLLINHYWLALPWVLLFGIAVSFTACVYPLVPIVTSLAAGRDTAGSRAYLLVLVYVLGMSSAMAVLGAVFGLFQINLQALLQRPWIIVLVALFFAGLALAMFDVYTIQTPRWLQSHTHKLSHRQKSGSFTGAAVMGALSVLVVSPCATPALSVLLTAVTVTSPAKGALALFIFGFGTGLPLLLFASAFRRFMPKAGAWMTAVKRLIGFLMLGVALWLIIRLLPAAVGGWFWAALALAAAVSFNGEAEAASGRLRFILRYLAGAAFLAAVFAVVQQRPAADAGPARGAEFTLVKTVPQLEAAVHASEKPVIVDFYADWCTACKVWEKTIWQNPRFTQPLAAYTLLKIDMTDYTENDKSLLRTLNLVGPPAVLFYRSGRSLTMPDVKIVGELAPDAFAAYLH